MNFFLSSYINFSRFTVFNSKNVSFNGLLTKLTSGMRLEEYSKHKITVYIQAHKDSRTEVLHKLQSEIMFQKKPNVSFKNKLKLLVMLALFSWKAEAIQYEEYMLFHHANRCINYFEYFEEKYEIPKHLLRSISTVESGRWNQKVGLYLPWPWAVNQGGRAYYYSTKEEAIEGVKSMLAKGITNIDIGCMQINLHHHPEAFSNLNQAFEPKDNIEYASNFLRNNYQSFRSWKKAVAAYHSLSELGTNYAAKVYNIFLKYRSGALALNHCTSSQGALVSCKNGTSISTGIKFKIDHLKNNQPKFQKTINNSLRKDPKRLKSTMVLYSSTQEEN